MGTLIRQLTAKDASAWHELMKAWLGQDHPDRRVYDLAWANQQFVSPGGLETWGAEVDGALHAAVSVIPPSSAHRKSVLNAGRFISRPESYTNGTAATLWGKVIRMAEERRQLVVTRVLASDNEHQAVCEQLGFSCVGFQPFQHMLRHREGVLYYLRLARADMVSRQPLSESLSQVSELATTVLDNLKLPQPTSVRDGVTGYPLQAETEFQDATHEEYKTHRAQAQSANPPTEISGALNIGWGLFRTTPGEPLRAIIARRGGVVTAGLAYLFDEYDRCLRVVEQFATDDLSPGTIVQRAVTLAQDKFNAVYIEVDILMTAPRLLKSIEQLGFVPVAYLPSTFSAGLDHIDVVKMVKLNMAYGQENARLTAHAKSIADIIDRMFQDQKVGVAIINLLRALPIFNGLGDGELRKISRLFTQKLYKAGERVFAKGDSGSEAYVVMRGQVDIILDDQDKPIATMGNGQILGELAFLDGAQRVAEAVVSHPSILLVVQRTAFNDLVHREPHLGMVVMRNIALELSNRLRRANLAMSSLRH